jgi:hypothetical protein
MAPRSPTHAFDPTPALEHNQHNFSPLNYQENQPTRAVHFSDPPAAPMTRHSIATTHVPLYPSVSSASQIPKQMLRITDPPPGIDINAYIENCRNLNEQLRQAHDTERKAWEIERTSMKARIAELEFKVNKSRDPTRRSSNDSSFASPVAFRADLRNQPDSTVAHGSRLLSDSAILSGPPVWRGPEFTPPVTRVFSHDDDVNHLPSISEDEPFPSLSKEISPTTKEPSHSVPIEHIDKTLDGVNLRSTGLTSSFVAKISSPSFSPVRTQSPRPPSNTLSAGGSLTVNFGGLLDPLDEKLKRHAGHTPMAIDADLVTSVLNTHTASPKEDDPAESAPARPPLRPAENSDSYFSSTNIPKVEAETRETQPDEAPLEPEPQLDATDDKALTGPLMLNSSARSQAATSFLDQVDAKLLEAAAASRDRSDTLTTIDSEPPPDPPPATGAATGAGTNGSKTTDEQSGDAKNPGFESTKMDDEMPRLRIKQSTNFGSAWGKAPTLV